MTKKEILVQIQCDGKRPFTAGIVLVNDRVIKAAPILSNRHLNMLNWSGNQVLAHCVLKGWRISAVGEKS